MGRPLGRKAEHHGETRAGLLGRIARRLGSADAARVSFRELARAAEVSPPTLRHYFQDREGVLDALLQESHAQALPYLHEIAAGVLPPLRESLAWYLGFVRFALTHEGLAAIHELGLSTGLRDHTLGPSYLRRVLEPTLAALEARLERHRGRGELRAGVDVRAAAIELVAPLLVAVLHQGALGGASLRPLELGPFCDGLLEHFLRAHAAEGGATPGGAA